MNADTLGQIATALERIESHLLTIARLLAAQQDIGVQIFVNGRSTLGEIRAGETQVASR